MKSKKIFLIIVILALAVICSIFIICYKYQKENNIRNSFKETVYVYEASEEFNKLEKYDKFFSRCISNIENGRINDLMSSDISKGIIINSKQELNELTKKYRILEDDYCISRFNIEDLENNSLIIYPYYNNTSIADISVTKVVYSDKNIDIDIVVSEGKAKNNEYGIEYGIEYETFANAQIVSILTDKIESTTKLNFNINRSKANLEKKVIDFMTVDKPIIYIYPKQDTNVEVALGYPENLTCVYPEYNSSWRVLAKPNGELTDLSTGRKLYALYYESIVKEKLEVKADGFIVSGKDTLDFLEDKLRVLGLTERESQEFIIYWLPKLQNNKYNYIHFSTLDQINKNMPLNILPNPDTIIRVLMEYKALEEPIRIKEQELVSPKRIGFTVVEWGGAKIK